jgi:spore coat protein U-like protein
MNRMISHKRFAAGLMLIAGFTAANARAATPSTGSMQVSMTIQAECKLQAASTSLLFGSHGVIDSNVDAQTTLGVQCTNSTPYSIGLDPGQGSGATVSARLMTGAANTTVAYAVYKDAAHSQLWGQTANVDAQAAVGTGAVQSFNIYGRVPAQSTPAPGGFSDLVAITVTY